MAFALQACPPVSWDGARRWLQETRPLLNKGQFWFLELVVDRTMVEFELLHPEESLRDRTGHEPMRYLLHGAPGTGKSHVVKYIKAFFRMIGFRQDLDYLVAAFQATNAADLEGHTIHHAFNIPWKGMAMDKPMAPETAKRLAHCRWTFFDEISMVPATLLAKIAFRLQEAKPDADPFKVGPGHQPRPFGGVNVVAIGDFSQLPPVAGGYLADIPRNYLQTGNQDGSGQAQDNLKLEGQRLMWEEFEGVVELTERQRCKDPYWNEVTDELRAGQLSEKNWCYLNGKPVKGCTLSEEERQSRRRVITGPNDPRLQEDRFKEAPAIVGTNDAKYQINKDRAQRYAKDTGAQLHWSQARDVASSEVLLVQPCDKERKIQTLGSDEEYVCYLSMYDYTNLLWRAFLKGAWQKLRRLPSQKEIPLVYDVFRIALNDAPASQTCVYMLRWLQYHDRDTNNLPGMLPLAIGMPVALTEHLDRGKQLLRGSVGHVHSWQWNDNDRRPSTVYVKFPDAEWMLDGINELGVYPICPVKREWYLDHGRDRPTLKVQRTQVPLTPAYAMTTHSSQGKTLKAVLLDLAFDKRAPPTIGLVAATRARSREDVLILRPFNGDLFRRGAPEGPRLLLEKLRGGQIHWDRLRDARKPSAKCSNCAEIKTLDFFSDWQWDQIRANKPGMCRLCKDGLPGSRKLEKEAESYQCCGCLMEKVEDAFPRAQLKQMDAETTRRCLQCLHAYTETLHCCRCKEIKALEYFEPDMLTMPAYATACKVCQQEVQQMKTKKWSGWFSCRACGKYFPTAVGAGDGQVRTCFNCASREPRTNGEQTCRNKSCKRKWAEEKLPGQEKRQRYCPQCRRN